MSSRHLCSHLITLHLDGASLPAETAVLEEIEPAGAILLSELAWPVGIQIVMRADELQAPATVIGCRRRTQDGWEVRIRFRDGFRWSPETWQPEHFFGSKSKLRRAAARD